MNSMNHCDLWVQWSRNIGTGKRRGDNTIRKRLKNKIKVKQIKYLTKYLTLNKSKSLVELPADVISA